MEFLAILLLTISAANSVPIDSRDCFDNSGIKCMEDFRNAVFYSNTGLDTCSELQKLANCSINAVDECYGDERDEKVIKGLEELENLYKSTCGETCRADKANSGVNSNSAECFRERKKNCSNTYEDYIFKRLFHTQTSTCNAREESVLCARAAVDDCFGDEYDENATKVLEQWEFETKRFCEPSKYDDTPFSFVRPPVSSKPTADYPKECIREKVFACRMDVNFPPREGETLDECRNQAERIAEGCSRGIVESCFVEDSERRDEERFQLYEAQKIRFDQQCERAHNYKEFYDFFNPHHTTEEKCIDDHSFYISRCDREASRISMPDENMKICLRWHSFDLCAIDRVLEMCGEETGRKYIKDIRVIPDYVKDACEAVAPLIADALQELPRRVKDHSKINDCSCPSTPESLYPKCALEKWSSWSPCSVECGTGLQIRTRLFLSKEAFYTCREHLELVQTVPCTVNCTVDLTEAKNLFRYMVSDEYLLEGEKCVAENNDYILDCINRASLIKTSNENSATCLKWDRLAGCSKARVRERCGEESRQRFLDQFPDKPEHVKIACNVLETDDDLFKWQ